MRQMAITICSMVSFMFNRRDNGFQLHNCLKFLATGVSVRVFWFLHTLSLTSCRRTVLRAMEHLRVSKQAQLRVLMIQSFKIPPVLCFDNLDILQKVHNTCLEASSKLFHGMWGYLHFSLPHLEYNLNQKNASDHLHYFLKSWSKKELSPVKLSLFRQTEADLAHWRLVIKSQLAQSLYKYIIKDGAE